MDEMTWISASCSLTFHFLTGRMHAEYPNVANEERESEHGDLYIYDITGGCDRLIGRIVDSLKSDWWIIYPQIGTHLHVNTI